jgi:hypothetical protein
MGKIIFAFGQVVPQSIIEELLEEGYRESEIDTEMIETLYYYEFQDERI